MAGNGPLGWRKCTLKEDGTFCKGVEIGRRLSSVAIAAEAIGALRVEYDKNQVGSLHISRKIQVFQVCCKPDASNGGPC
jgi:hypothetical protein